MLFIGHSLIAFFDWQKRFPAHKVANLGVAGETVGGLLSRTAHIIKTHPSADLLFLMTGLNNIAMDDFGFLGSYRKIIEELSSAYPEAKICINSILPTMINDISNESIEEMNRSLKKLALNCRVDFLDVYGAFTDANGMPLKDFFLDDGVHLSEKGYALWSGALDNIIGASGFLMGSPNILCLRSSEA